MKYYLITMGESIDIEEFDSLDQANIEGQAWEEKTSSIHWVIHGTEKLEVNYKGVTYNEFSPGERVWMTDREGLIKKVTIKAVKYMREGIVYFDEDGRTMKDFFKTLEELKDFMIEKVETAVSEVKVKSVSKENDKPEG